MGYVVFEDVASGKLHEGMVWNPYPKTTKQEDAIKKCEIDSLATQIKHSQCKSKIRQLSAASVVSGFASLANLTNAFSPENFMPKGFENAFEFAFSQQGLTSVGLTLGLLGAAALFAKMASNTRDEKLEIEEELDYLDIKHDDLCNGVSYKDYEREEAIYNNFQP
jgi:hypothetical protein